MAGDAGDQSAEKFIQFFEKIGKFLVAFSDEEIHNLIKKINANKDIKNQLNKEFKKDVKALKNVNADCKIDFKDKMDAGIFSGVLEEAGYENAVIDNGNGNGFSVAYKSHDSEGIELALRSIEQARVTWDELMMLDKDADEIIENLKKNLDDVRKAFKLTKKELKKNKKETLKDRTVKARKVSEKSARELKEKLHENLKKKVLEIEK